MNKLAIISGGSKGLGAAFCNQLEQSNYQVIEFSRSAPHRFSVALDFSQCAQIESALSATIDPLAEQQWQEIIIIQNAASITPLGAVSDCAPTEVLTNAQLNFTGAIIFTQVIMRAFQKHQAKKTFAHMSSGAADHVYAGWSLYCASKAGLKAFYTAIQAEQAHVAQPFDIQIINPGLMDTQMQADIRSASLQAFPERGKFEQRQQDGLLRPADQVASEILKSLIS